MKFLIRAALALPLLALACGTNSAPAQDFSLSVTPDAQTLGIQPDGGVAAYTEQYTVTTAVTAGAAQSVAFTVTGLPPAVTGAFDPAAVTGTGTSTLTLDIPATLPAGNIIFAVTGTAESGTHTQPAALSVCISGGVTLAVTQTDLYTCTNKEYQASFSITNNTCSTLAVSEIDLAGALDSGSNANCIASGPSTYMLNNVTVAPGATKVVLPLEGNPYCCSSSPCPDFTCVETYSFQAVTSAGTVTAPSQEATIHLAENAPPAGCAVSICN